MPPAIKRKDRRKAFDKYKFYSRAVQAPEAEVELLQKNFKELTGRKARVLREDFCGTFANSCEWVRQGRDYVAHGVDLDLEPIAYGRERYLSRLTPAQQRRVRIHHDNVLSPNLPSADIIAALNFSFFIFQQREQLLSYFANVRRTLKRGGLFFADMFGGSECQEENTATTRMKGFTYYWEQGPFDPVRNHSVFWIHVKPTGGPIHRRLFTYDWRLWSIPEVRDVLREAGFNRTHVMWEGHDKNGEGNGEYEFVEEGEECETWNAYVVAEK